MTTPDENKTVGSPERVKATRIEEDSKVFKWVVPAVLIALSVITVLLLLAVLWVLFD